MKRDDFDLLQLGDICTIVQGNDKGMKVRVVYIDEETRAVLVKPYNPNDKFWYRRSYGDGRIRLVNYMNLRL